MIHKEQRKKIKKILGYHYSDKVLKILKEKGITNKKGTVYGSSMIRNVFNGLNENKEIEIAILELFVNTLEEKEEVEKIKKQLLDMSDYLSNKNK
ncbi:hypothetical protein [uncultured Kordia sp.]|uniref:hypothetical protein n=1 Tax=uncultured Kordia sp. TaxID=507699 RepID=UPI002639E6F6|nr:hypothetical protein [uncultured Kordia sp.]